MEETSCPVSDTVKWLKGRIETGRFTTPKSRRIAEEILDLLGDVALGAAGGDHMKAMKDLAAELAEPSGDADASNAGSFLLDRFDSHSEVFQSHIETHNCATGDCLRLSPAPCQMTCPAGLDIPTYVSLIGQGLDDQAVDVIRRDCPFPWVCGLVCTRPCEFMCVRKRIDEPIAIKSLKGFAAEKSMSQGSYRNPEKQPPKGKKVCVVGAGPGGMSAAYYLVLRGYEVEIFESQPVAGGMLLLGIPRYRLPGEIIDREVSMLKELGVVFHFNTTFGADVTFDQLKAKGFDAFFFAVGAHRCFELDIPGEKNFPTQVKKAIHLLRDVGMGKREKPGDRVIVVGGGNVAIDAARTCLRLGAKEVTIAYRRTRAEMPADHEEVEQAEEEGIKFDFLNVPIEVVGEGDRLTGLHCLRAQLVSVEGKNRKYPKPISGSDFTIPADTLILAIGQRVDRNCLDSVDGLDWTRRNTIMANTITTETSVPGVFAAGDAVSGPATVIEAIGGGKRAALAIDRYLEGMPQPEMPSVPVRRGRVEFQKVPAGKKMALKRPDMPLLKIDRRRTTFQQVELGLTEDQVRDEACRCLRCDVCLRCGKCVEVCRDKMGVNALQLGYFDFHHPVETDYRVTQEKCVACGACAANCPTGAMQMTDQDGERILSLCGTVLNRQKLLYCKDCGDVLGPARYLDFVRSRTDSVVRASSNEQLCDKCARKSGARRNV